MHITRHNLVPSPLGAFALPRRGVACGKLSAGGWSGSPAASGEESERVCAALPSGLNDLTRALA